LRRSRLAGDHLELAKRRTLLITAFLWLPLLFLSALSGTAIGDGLGIPFLYDIEVQVRFLVVVPLMVASEILVHERLSIVKTQFLARNLIPENLVPQFEKTVASAFKLRNSIVAEVLIVVFVYAVGVGVIWKNVGTVSTSTWYSLVSDGQNQLKWAGFWYEYVSVPISQFLLIRWYYRIFIWIRFLFQVSRIQLNLLPTHPDNVGGLGFMSPTIHAFLPLAMVHGAFVAGWIATRIFYMNAALLDFKVEIIVMVVFVLLIMLVPFLVFAGQLARAKRKGVVDYGQLASRYVNEYNNKWRQGNAPKDEKFIGSGDIQSLADLANSYEVVRKMQIAPITRDMLISLAVAVLLPILPLVLTMMPLKDLLKLLSGIIL